MPVSKKEIYKTVELMNKIHENTLEIPNELTIQIGRQIKKARIEKGWSQSDLAKKMGRRQATISDYENGKSDFNIFTLILLSQELRKPISYFVSIELIHNFIAEVGSPIQQEALNLIQRLEIGGGAVGLALDFLKLLASYLDITDDEEDFD